MDTAARQRGLDALRAAAALAVVVIHVSATALQHVAPGSADWWFADLYHAATVWAVPVFVMISGALLLDPARSDTARAFLTRRAGRILVPLAFWSALYLGVRYYRGQVDAMQAMVDLLFGLPFAHLWYLYMAAGLYLVTPPLRVFVAAARPTELRYATFLALAIGIAANETGYLIGLPSALAVLLFAPFVGYYLLGHLLRDWWSGAGKGSAGELSSPLFLMGVAAAATAVTAIGTGLIRQGFPDFTGWKILCDQLSPTVMAAAVAVYLTAPAIERGSGTAAAAIKCAGTWVAPYALGIYVVHPLVMMGLEGVGLSAVALGTAAGVPAVSVAVFLLSLGLCRVLALVPGARMVIGIGARD